MTEKISMVLITFHCDPEAEFDTEGFVASALARAVEEAEGDLPGTYDIQMVIMPTVIEEGGL